MLSLYFFFRSAHTHPMLGVVGDPFSDFLQIKFVGLRSNKGISLQNTEIREGLISMTPFSITSDKIQFNSNSFAFSCSNSFPSSSLYYLPCIYFSAVAYIVLIFIYFRKKLYCKMKSSFGARQLKPRYILLHIFVIHFFFAL